MPNHLHGIIIIGDTGCRGEASGIERTTHPRGCLPDASPIPGRAVGVALGSIGQ
jgi:hypothetical protein